MSGTVMVACAVALMLPASARSHRATTNPLTTVNVYVTVTNKGPSISLASVEYESGVQTLTVETVATRGQIATFVVRNHSKSRYAFSVLGKKTAVLAPRQSARLKIALIHRGRFSYDLTLGTGKVAYRGFFQVA